MAEKKKKNKIDEYQEAKKADKKAEKKAAAKKETGKKSAGKKKKTQRELTCERKKKSTFITSFSADEIADIVVMVNKGCTQYDIANKFHISISFLKGLLRNNKDLRLLYERAKENADAAVESALYQRCLGYTYTKKLKKEKLDRLGNVVELNEEVLVNVPPDPFCIKFYLTNRLRDKWKEHPEPVVVDEEGGVRIIELGDVMEKELPPDEMIEPKAEAEAEYHESVPEVIYGD